MIEYKRKEIERYSLEEQNEIILVLKFMYTVNKKRYHNLNAINSTLDALMMETECWNLMCELSRFESKLIEKIKKTKHLNYKKFVNHLGYSYYNSLKEKYPLYFL